MTRLVLVLAACLATLGAACEMTGEDYLPVPQAVDGGAPDRGVSPCRVNADGGADGADEGKTYLACPDGGGEVGGKQD